MTNIETMLSNVSFDGNIEEEKQAIELFQAKEEEIQKKKLQIRQKVELQLSRAEEETKRLSRVWEELEVLTDPVRKELATVRKKVDSVNRELRSLGISCQKKEKEYKEASEALHQKNEERNQLTVALAELVKESDKARMKKLEELNKILEPSC
ncbi:hypothetical protein CTI12_AA354900 [Artemisia annua]|uniref:Uncharacterized protein n=1 Tax=Artemisia annua TaxID=35608 RepID=A0A2U1MPF3_ARTAN|nr:hypothetical protein CTI12_AA354900 [Artemisia annua]